MFLFTYLFLAALGLRFSRQDLFLLQCAGFSSCGTCTSELQSTGSAVAVQGLRCLGARGILVPQPGIEPSSPALEDGFLTTGPPGKSFLHVGGQLF